MNGEMRRLFLAFSILLLASLACNSSGQDIPPTPENSIFDSGKTAYGFFPSPPEATLESILQLFKDISAHGDFVLIQQNTAWEDFVSGTDGESQTRTDLINQVKLARQNNLEYIFVIDALNGLNRREFAGLPASWEANFGNPDIRLAYRNYALWVVQQFHPRYLGLASEINTYMDAYPDDVQNFISLYNEIYALVKAEAPETQIFVTFQWEDLNNMFPQHEEGNRERFDTNWEQIEAFEPNLDLWVISSYPYFVFNFGAEIPENYFAPLLSRTNKPVAIAEGGFSSQPVGFTQGTPEDQVAYLNAIHDQLGPRLVFWVNTLLNDFNLESYAEQMKKDGRDPQDILLLGAFAYIGLRNADGSSKPALDVWDEFRKHR
ncbi:MAG: hypothetical protein L0287_20875 [Anaerolineae bacterium]|nr:hypothetical protein [Anaerolineae bacterium]MCI0609227.1 hypothetical protein [Anaerolineae bacterium]